MDGKLLHLRLAHSNQSNFHLNVSDFKMYPIYSINSAIKHKDEGWDRFPLQCAGSPPLTSLHLHYPVQVRVVLFKGSKEGGGELT